MIDFLFILDKMIVRGVKMKLFIIVIFTLALLLGARPVFAAQNYVGIILSGYETDCEVVHQGAKKPCTDEKHLYIGDTITKKPSIRMLEIKWAPYVKEDIKDDISMEVAVQPEQLKGKTYAAAVKQWVAGFFEPTKLGATVMATRGFTGGEMQLPLCELPSHATLMQDYPIEISWAGEDVRSITIVDMKDKTVYEDKNPVNSEGPVSLLPRELGIKPREKYTVYITTDYEKRKLDILLMDGMTQDEVLTGLKNIDSENLPKPDYLLGKVAYLQLISDVFPDKIDLYWLGRQLLEKNRDMYQFTEDQERVIKALDKRYNDHYEKTE
jgi:hypothetical protein